jgi:acetoin utilization deacetylase AcuC-like enzyme
LILGTGAAEVVGKGKGLNYNLNVPLQQGLSGTVFVKCFQTIVGNVIKYYTPDAIVMQCGADGLGTLLVLSKLSIDLENGI